MTRNMCFASRKCARPRSNAQHACWHDDMRTFRVTGPSVAAAPAAAAAVAAAAQCRHPWRSLAAAALSALLQRPVPACQMTLLATPRPSSTVGAGSGGVAAATQGAPSRAACRTAHSAPPAAAELTGGVVLHTAAAVEQSPDSAHKYCLCAAESAQGRAL